MTFKRLEGIATSFPLGAFEGTIIENNSTELRTLMVREHSSGGVHGKGRVAVWRGLGTITDEALPRVVFLGQQPWPQAAATITRIDVGKWRFWVGGEGILAAFAEVVTPGTIGSGCVAHVVATAGTSGEIYSFEVHTQQGNSTTLADADLPFTLTIYPVQSPEPLAMTFLTEDGDSLTTEDGDILGE